MKNTMAILTVIAQRYPMKRLTALCSLVIIMVTGGAALAGPASDSMQAALDQLTAQATPADRGELERLKNAFAKGSTPAASGVSAPISFSARGIGTLTSSKANACFGTCTVTHCNCLIIQGTANVTGLGNCTFSESVTINLDGCLDDGDQSYSCCTADGGVIFQKGADSIGTISAGQACTFMDPVSHSQNFVAHMNLSIVPGAGKYAKARGTGVLEKSIFLTSSGYSVFESANGMIQVKAP